MSWDAGAISNFGALTFPTDSAAGGGAVETLVVSTLIADSAVVTNNLSVSTIALCNQKLQYTYGSQVSTNVVGLSTFTLITLPFSYINTNYAVTVNYSDNAARVGVLNTNPLMPLIESVSSFTIENQPTARSYNVSFITSGNLN